MDELIQRSPWSALSKVAVAIDCHGYTVGHAVMVGEPDGSTLIMNGYLSEPLLVTIRTFSVAPIDMGSTHLRANNINDLSEWGNERVC